MEVAEVKFASWDKAYYFSLNDLVLKKNDKVVVNTELGLELGTLFDFKNIDESEFDDPKKILKPIIRKATSEDLKKIPTDKEKEDSMNYCKEMIIKHGLNMKLVDVNFSFSLTRVNFAFIADGRVDFRELVKELTNHFNKLIRLTQIGIRDEAKFMGDCGHCGKELCCRKFIKDFSSISSEMAEAQQVVHRGSDRISGVCGRLMCCLQYEYNGYKDLAEKMPDIGQTVNVDGKKGVVTACHVLKQTVNVEFYDKKEGKSIEEIDLNRHKK